MPSLSFTKMHGLGNDFVLVDDLGPLATQGISLSQIAQRLCDRRLGVGADQILWLKKPQKAGADIRMEILNADGSEAEMCGNGIRAVGLYLYRHFRSQPSYLIETLAGLKKVELQGEQVLVDMGAPQFGVEFSEAGEEFSITGSGETLRFFEVSMGNPHAVFFVKSLASIPVEKWGPLIERHSRFPERTNVEFVEVLDAHTLRVKVWERGAGMTLACGTGACASAVASLALKKTQGSVEVQLPGGALQVTWGGKVSDSVMMKGSAEEVFQGHYPVK